MTQPKRTRSEKLMQFMKKHKLFFKWATAVELLLFGIVAPFAGCFLVFSPDPFSEFVFFYSIFFGLLGGFALLINEADGWKSWELTPTPMGEMK
jgi:hypothetical protein